MKGYTILYAMLTYFFAILAGFNAGASLALYASDDPFWASAMMCTASVVAAVFFFKQTNKGQ